MQGVSGTADILAEGKKLKVLWLAPYPIDRVLPPAKLLNSRKQGKANWLVNLAGVLANNFPVELHILCHSANINKNEFVIQNNIQFHIIHYKMPFIKKGFPQYFRYDIWSKYSGFIKPSLKLVNEIKPDIIHIHGTEGAFGLLSGKLNEYPIIISMQGIINELYKRNIRPSRIIQKKQEKSVIRNNINFGCRTNWDKSIVLNYNKKAKIFYLPEAINEIFYNVNWQDENRKEILFVGAIMKRKGIEDLLKVIVLLKNEFEDIRLWIVGKGNEKYIQKLKKYSIKNKINKNIVWLGFQNSNEIASKMKNIAVYVLPSYADNSPNSLCEAMAAGVPAVAYASGGIPSLIENGVNGLLVTTGHVTGLVEAVRSLLINNALRIKLHENARRTAFERNYPKVVAEITYKTYNTIIG